MKDVSKSEFVQNKEKEYAVLRALEIIGEASKNLSRGIKAEHPEVEWSDIAGMRDKLIHQYFGVNIDLVWETIKADLPQLEKTVHKILAKGNATR